MGEQGKQIRASHGNSLPSLYGGISASDAMEKLARDCDGDGGQ